MSRSITDDALMALEATGRSSKLQAPGYLAHRSEMPVDSSSIFREIVSDRCRSGRKRVTMVRLVMHAAHLKRALLAGFAGGCAMLRACLVSLLFSLLVGL